MGCFQWKNFKMKLWSLPETHPAATKRMTSVAGTDQTAWLSELPNLPNFCNPYPELAKENRFTIHLSKLVPSKCLGRFFVDTLPETSSSHLQGSSPKRDIEKKWKSTFNHYFFIFVLLVSGGKRCICCVCVLFSVQRLGCLASTCHRPCRSWELRPRKIGGEQKKNAA